MTAAARNSRQRAALCGAFLVGWLHCAAASAQSALLPPECKGKTGAQLDQCARDVSRPTVGEEVFEPVEQKPDPRRTLNCNLAVKADQNFCIARNEINRECANAAKYPNFDACAGNLMGRQPLPRDADCTRLLPAQRNQCALRNKVYRDCQKDPWLYFICLHEKMPGR